MSIKHEQLISVVSEYLDKEITNLKTEHQAVLENLKAEHQAVLANLNAEHQEEIARLKNKLTNMVQTDDLNKFQKRTIASLTAEVSTMQATITSLEKRLKMASEELRSLKQPGATPPLALSNPILSQTYPQQQTDPQPQPQTDPQPQPQLQPRAPIFPTPSEPQSEDDNKDQEQKEAAPEAENQNDDAAELIPVVLQSGTYFWDPDSNDLYEFLSDEEAGEVVGFIKSVKIKNQIYYLDTTDNNFYEMLDEGSGTAGAIGKHLGQIVDKKAVFLRHK